MPVASGTDGGGEDQRGHRRPCAEDRGEEAEERGEEVHREIRRRRYP